MRSSIVAVIVASVVLAGCSISIGSGSVVYESHCPACVDIDAALAMSFSSERAAALRTIAAREDLGAHEQIHLIDAVMDGVGFSGDKVDVLVILARNPALTPAARAHMSARLEDVEFSSDRKRIFDALNQ